MTKKQTEVRKKSKKDKVSESEEIDDMEDDEDYDEEQDSQDNDFIADDEEVYKEQKQEERRKRKELKKEKREKGKYSDDELEDDDYDVIEKGYGRKRILKKNNQNQPDSDEEFVKPARIKRDADQQIPQAQFKREDHHIKVDSQKKGGIFQKRDQTTASDDDEKEQIGQQLKDKFITEELDEVFGTLQDQKIMETDIPERLQIKLQNRFSPTQQELETEAEWIFHIIVEDLEQSKDQTFATKIQSVKQKIVKCLSMFRKEQCDIPYITKVWQYELLPELSHEHTWRIFQLDIEYGKFLIQKKQYDDFFAKIHEIADENLQKSIEHQRNQIFYINSMRDLNDFTHLMNFYKSYFQRELEAINESKGKKVPFQKRDLVHNARLQKLDDFSRRCMLNPLSLQENLNEDKQLYKPNNHQIGPKELAKEYVRKADEAPYVVINDMCAYTAIELSSQPDIRRGLKKHIYEYGYIMTEPTEKGKKELDVFHPSYRTKRVNKKISDFSNTDLFIDILQNQSMGLINFEIDIRDDCTDKELGNRFFEKMLNMYIIQNDTSKWKFVRREVFNILTQTVFKSRGQKSFILSILDEIKEELKEDAEKFVLRQAGEKYADIINSGYFTLEKRDYQNQDKDNGHIEDLIPQRDRLNVLGAVLHPIDNRNFLTTVAVVDKFGELVAHKDFLYLLPPRRRPANAQMGMRPGEEDEKKKHDNDKEQFQNILREQKVDLIVVCADCLEAKRLKKSLSEFAMFNNQQDQNDNDEPRKEANEAFVIWGRPEIPKLFASSHYSQKLLKNFPFVLKKAICLARIEQDPMNEVLNLWSPIMSENQALNIDLHPLQKHINQARLLDKLEEINIQTVNNIGIDINLLVKHEHWHNQLQFLSGLGPRKAQKLIQNLKSLNQPLQTKKQMQDEKILGYFCLNSCFSMIKVRVPSEEDNQKFNIFDQTRIHHKQYEVALKIAQYQNSDGNLDQIDNIRKDQSTIVDIIRNPSKLKELMMNDHMFKDKVNSETYVVDQVVTELMYPFRDPREQTDILRTLSNQDQKFTNKQLFYCLIDESERTFKEGIIVSATVFKVYDSKGDKPARILCRLENGLDANIGENDADFFNQNAGYLSSVIDVGSIVTGRISQIKFGEGKNGEKFDDNFSVILKCRQEDLKRHDAYVEYIQGDMQIPEEDLFNYNFKMQEEQTQNQKKFQIQKRKIQHPRFQNISSVQAISLLNKEDNGEFYFRPSSKGTDHLTLTWKFYNKNIVHIDILELDKALGANIGSKLKIGDESYENLHEISERYITPCNRLVREVQQHAKFHGACQNLDELKSILENEKQEDLARIPYRFAIFEKYPQYVILAYIPKKEVVKEFLKIKPKGYFFHHQYHYPFQNMINWFKQEFRNRDYQRYLRKASSPQPLTVDKRMNAQQNPSNIPMAQTGMQIDQTGPAWGAEGAIKEEGGKGYGRGLRSPPRNEWGASNTNNSSQIKDERERGGWDNGNNDWGGNNNQSPQRDNFGGGGGRGRGRGRGRGDGGGGNVCFKCNEPGHFARECPNDQGGGHQSKGFGRGRGFDGPRKCYNCQGEGHLSRDCPEPRRERDGGEPPYKRQRRDDGDENHRTESAWAAQKNSHVDSGWGNQDQRSQGDSGWGNQNDKFTPGGDGNNEEKGGWGTNPTHSQDKNTPGGWN